MLKGRKLIELSYDVQAGLGRIDVPDFDRLRTMGMAATLAIHLRGLQEIEFEVLRKVSDHFFSIPSYALREVIEILGEIEYVGIVKKDGKILSIIPDIPHFKDIYERVGDYFSFSELNEHEQGTLLILSELQQKPENRDRLVSNIGIDHKLMERCVNIGETGNYFKEFRARGRNIIASPFYFSDNLGELADLTAKVGADDISIVLDVIKSNQGWPLSLIQKRAELGGKKLTNQQMQLLIHLCSEGILKPPSIEFKNSKETFVFTPKPGKSRLDSSNREIYERAMALVACVRKGQLLAEQFRIKMPIRILEVLRDQGYIGSNSEAASQYRNLVFLRVGHLKHIAGDRYQFHLNPEPENKAALDLAINLLRTGELANLDVKQEARIALSKDEKYIQSIISAAELKGRSQVTLHGESAEQFEQLILAYE
ncbi:hypothetical protein KMS_R20000 [Pseudomonas sp. LRP2-20]|uniref:hypothetical protein n=1 Tax=Pseudomonas sp. LRP2-20 TaxID=2944234 RepID=UPI002189B786|nr:hypothetical protein [Pseudomonas sp. LRP2-20]BDM22242.1 hypothetical protein KMS_R20000 [Pseudomonas sp. LRP2-20]